MTRPKGNAEAQNTPSFAEKTWEGASVAAGDGSGGDGASISRLTVAWAVLNGKVISIERSDFAVELQGGGLNGVGV